MQICPQCSNEIIAPSCRLVQDSCGHQKCRTCLLGDVESCKQCQDVLRLNNSESVIKYESSHHGVISFNQSTVIKDCHSDKTDQNVQEEESLIRKRSYQTVVIPNHIVVNKDTPNVYTCTVCNKSFKTRVHVKYHQYCAGGKKPLKCAKCQKEFISKTHLEIHMLSHADRRPFSCDTCGKSFLQYSKLNRHYLSHTDSRPCICSICGKSFRTKDKLKIHLLIHNHEKPYCCKQCTARFNNSSNLKKHLSVHSTEGVHMCDQCGKRFKFKTSLMLHHKIHANIRSYTCRNCTKSFFNLKDLQRHMLVHSDEKLYNCDECKTCFRRKDNLYRHIRNSHPGKMALVTQKNIKPHSKTSITDNPNAIKVITSSSVLTPKKPELSSPPSVPIKLAFKTAFKDIIRRNIEPECDNIYEQILHLKSAPNGITDKIEATPSTNIKAEKYDLRQPLLYGTSQPCGVSKYIKFKVFQNYGNMDATKTPLEQLNAGGPEKVYTELRTVENSASVIVNNERKAHNLHWRKRTSQSFTSSLGN